MKEHKIPCPKCKQPLRHSGLSNLYWCHNPVCVDYEGTPEINVGRSFRDLNLAFKNGWLNNNDGTVTTPELMTKEQFYKLCDEVEKNKKGG